MSELHSGRTEKEERENEWVWTSWIRGRQKHWQQLEEKFLRVPIDVKQHRYGICRQCEEFVSFTTQCRLCFCAMGIKTWYAGFSCPKGKWPEESPPPDINPEPEATRKGKNR